MSVVDTEQVLDRLIVGRVTPRIYAFKTNTLPNYLKVGDTYRPVARRLHEWEKHFPNLSKEFEVEATISDDVYFRDFAVHRFLEKELGKVRLLPSQLPKGVYYSREFFRKTQAVDIESAIEDIQKDYAANSGKYVYYDANKQLPRPFIYERGAVWVPRPNQQEAIDNFKKAVAAGRTNLLMYAVMRFGKSFTSLCCAKAISAKTVVVVSAKADVKNEWKKTVEAAGNFEGWHFVDSEALVKDEYILDEIHHNHHTAVIFLTLQDLQGKELKEKHRAVFDSKIDVLIVDETHYGARAEEYGRVLRDAGQPTDPKVKNDPDRDDEIDPEMANNSVKEFRTKVKLHLSGTPYRILMGSEFAPEDIISFVQFSDIVREQKAWDLNHLNTDETNEWDNPYFGFPQMIRFAFNPNASSRKKMQELRDQGYSFAMSKLLEPNSIKFDKEKGQHRKFKHEAEILELLRVIDGTQEDENVLGFLDYDKLKEGKMCRHMVVVLPYRASCDALEQLIDDHATEFKNLGSYKVINISGVEGARSYRSPDDVKRAIAKAEANDQKTITLTVNRMLTGSTVEQWDTMLFLKDTASPQEYDQAIFRIQNQYTRTLVGSDGKIIKENLKPQTLLVDFDPQRLFRMQEQKSLIYNANTESNGNDKLEERLREEVRISPVVTINAGKINEVDPTDILRAVSDYNKNRSVADEARDIPADLGVLSDKKVREVIEQQAEIGSRSGLTVKPVDGDGDGDEIDVDVDPKKGTPERGGKKKKRDIISQEESAIRSLERKLQTYYQRVLFYAMLTASNVNSLAAIVESMELIDNRRIANNLGLEKSVLQLLLRSFDPFKLSALDYKIQNISRLGHEESLTPVERASRALTKFNRISNSEVRTPSGLCEEMVEEIPGERLKSMVESGQKILDIASKSGEFAIALYQRLTGELELDHKQVTNSIYAIPTSSIAYEFTLKFYKILGLNTDNIVAHFSTYDLLRTQTSKGEIDYQHMARILTQNKSFKSIRLHDQPEEGAVPVRFGVVVGNPPYQEERKGTSARQIYPYFMDASYAIAPVACLVTPAKFLSGAGNSADAWNNRILKDGHIHVARYWDSAARVFADVEIKGGIVVTVRDVEKDYGELGAFSIYPPLKGIIEKVKAKWSDSLRSEVHLQLKFNLDKLYEDYPEYKEQIGSHGKERRLTTNIFKKLPELFDTEPKQIEDVKILGLISLKRTVRYINPKYIEASEQIKRWKVVFPKTSGSGSFGEPLAGPEILGPGSGHTQSFISLGSFESEFEAKAMLLYLRTKFARALLSTRKVTQDNNSEVWESVPLQDFTETSPIDWSRGVEEVDQQLFEMYNLTEDERRFVLDHVQVM